MKQYPVDKLRNVVLLGQGRSGKTSFAEAALFLTKGTDRLGKTGDGNTVCDFDAEETKRQISISTAVAPVEYKGHKINFLDTPGYLDFVGEVMQGVRVAETALLVVSGMAEVAVILVQTFRKAKDDEEHPPRLAFLIAKLTFCAVLIGLAVGMTVLTQNW